ncbi:MAG: hypothetical protein Q9166_003220 [cf. Caloplaca sp. 2 TL-2023]
MSTVPYSKHQNICVSGYKRRRDHTWDSRADIVCGSSPKNKTWQPSRAIQSSAGDSSTGNHQHRLRSTGIGKVADKAASATEASPIPRLPSAQKVSRIPSSSAHGVEDLRNHRWIVPAPYIRKFSEAETGLNKLLVAFDSMVWRRALALRKQKAKGSFETSTFKEPKQLPLPDFQTFISDTQPRYTTGGKPARMNEGAVPGAAKVRGMSCAASREPQWTTLWTPVVSRHRKENHLFGHLPEYEKPGRLVRTVTWRSAHVRVQPFYSRTFHAPSKNSLKGTPVRQRLDETEVLSDQSCIDATMMSQLHDNSRRIRNYITKLVNKYFLWYPTGNRFLDYSDQLYQSSMVIYGLVIRLSQLARLRDTIRESLPVKPKDNFSQLTDSFRTSRDFSIFCDMMKELQLSQSWIRRHLMFNDEFYVRRHLVREMQIVPTQIARLYLKPDLLCFSDNFEVTAAGSSAYTRTRQSLGALQATLLNLVALELVLASYATGILTNRAALDSLFTSLAYTESRKAKFTHLNPKDSPECLCNQKPGRKALPNFQDFLSDGQPSKVIEPDLLETDESSLASTAGTCKVSSAATELAELRRSVLARRREDKKLSGHFPECEQSFRLTGKVVATLKDLISIISELCYIVSNPRNRARLYLFHMERSYSKRFLLEYSHHARRYTRLREKRISGDEKKKTKDGDPALLSRHRHYMMLHDCATAFDLSSERTLLLYREVRLLQQLRRPHLTCVHLHRLFLTLNRSKIAIKKHLPDEYKYQGSVIFPLVQPVRSHAGVSIALENLDGWVTLRNGRREKLHAVSSQMRDCIARFGGSDQRLRDPIDWLKEEMNREERQVRSVIFSGSLSQYLASDPREERDRDGHLPSNHIPSDTNDHQPINAALRSLHRLVRESQSFVVLFKIRYNKYLLFKLEFNRGARELKALANDVRWWCKFRHVWNTAVERHRLADTSASSTLIALLRKRGDNEIRTAFLQSWNSIHHQYSSLHLYRKVYSLSSHQVENDAYRALLIPLQNSYREIGRLLPDGINGQSTDSYPLALIRRSWLAMYRSWESLNDTGLFLTLLAPATRCMRSHKNLLPVFTWLHTEMSRGSSPPDSIISASPLGWYLALKPSEGHREGQIYAEAKPASPISGKPLEMQVQHNKPHAYLRDESREETSPHCGFIETSPPGSQPASLILEPSPLSRKPFGSTTVSTQNMAAFHTSTTTTTRRPLSMPTVHDKPCDGPEDLQAAVSDNNGTIVCEVGSPLGYHIPFDKMRESMLASRSSRSAYWQYTLYEGPKGEKVKVHYCKSLETTERIARLFLNESVVGFDIEWKPSATTKDGIRKNVALIQLASEERIALFHVARFPKDDAVESLVSPTFKAIMESASITKVGVSVRGDCSRLKKHMNIDCRGLFELSHLYKLVKFSNTEVKKINKVLVALAKQVEEHLMLPMYKDDSVRGSDWSEGLNYEQIYYAASDSYAGFQLYHILNNKRLALSPPPPLPANADLKLPIRLANGQTVAEYEEPAHEGPPPNEGTATTPLPSTEQPAGDVMNLQIEDNKPPQTGQKPELQKPTPPRARHSPSLSSHPSIVAANEWIIKYRSSISNPSSYTNRYMPSSNDATYPSLPSTFSSSTTSSTIPTLSPTSTSPPTSQSSNKPRATPAFLRAYFLFHHHALSITDIASLLRDPPLQKSTVASYVLEAARLDGLELEKGRVEVCLECLDEGVKGKYRWLRGR